MTRPWWPTSWSATRHATAPRVCRLSLIDQGRCLRIEVDDGSPEPPRMRTPDRHGGRGLVLVDRLASAWGVDQHGRGKTVWAELVVDHCRQRSCPASGASPALAHRNGPPL
jgi:hypothetical protein